MRLEKKSKVGVLGIPILKSKVGDGVAQ